MKSLRLIFLLISLATLLLAARVRNEVKRQDANATAAGTSGAAASGSNSTSASGGAQTSNAIGKLAPNAIITGPPFNIESCDQVVQFPGQTLTNINDFSQKADAYFTMSAYLVNQFVKNDPSTLQESIALDKMSEFPQILSGSVSCLKFIDNYRTIYMCMKDEDTANQVIGAFKKFMKCRIGDNGKGATASSITRILKASCLGLDVSFDIKNFGNDLNKAKAALQTAITNALKNASYNLRDSIKKQKEAQADPAAALDGKPPSA